ncbi:TdeIII family type II restriction endonuclease [Alcaligenes aquatilis]
MRPDCAAFIENELRSCVNNTIQRLEQEDTHRPFHSALLSETALFWSRFERSFSTSFGQRVIEQISKAAAISGGASEAENQRPTPVNLSLAQLNAIEDHIASLRNGSSGRVAGWEADVRNLSAVRPSADKQELRVISDLWWKKDGIDHFMSIKTVKPNIDQTAEAKRDLLKLKLAYPNSKVYYGLYYNPYGERREDYAWGPPKKLFNFGSDESVLIGRDYWDTLGGKGFYEELLAIAEKVGVETRLQIEALR